MLTSLVAVSATLSASLSTSLSTSRAWIRGGCICLYLGKTRACLALQVAQVPGKGCMWTCGQAVCIMVFVIYERAGGFWSAAYIYMHIDPPETCV